MKRKWMLLRFLRKRIVPKWFGLLGFRNPYSGRALSLFLHIIRKNGHRPAAFVGFVFEAAKRANSKGRADALALADFALDLAIALCRGRHKRIGTDPLSAEIAAWIENAAASEIKRLIEKRIAELERPADPSILNR